MVVVVTGAVVDVVVEVVVVGGTVVVGTVVVAGDGCVVVGVGEPPPPKTPPTEVEFPDPCPLSTTALSGLPTRSSTTVIVPSDTAKTKAITAITGHLVPDDATGAGATLKGATLSGAEPTTGIGTSVVRSISPPCAADGKGDSLRACGVPASKAPASPGTGRAHGSWTSSVRSVLV